MNGLLRCSFNMITSVPGSSGIQHSLRALFRLPDFGNLLGRRAAASAAAARASRGFRAGRHAWELKAVVRAERSAKQSIAGCVRREGADLGAC